MKKYLKQFGFVALLLVMIVGVSGCSEKNESKESNTKKVSQSQDNESATKKKDSKEVSHQTKEEDKIIINPDGSIDTSNWKTYVNDDFGFTMKYPADENEIKVVHGGEEIKPLRPAMSTENYIWCKNETYNSKEGFFIGKNEKGYTLDEYIDNYPKTKQQLIYIGEIDKKFSHLRKNKKIGNKDVYYYFINNPEKSYTESMYLWTVDDLVMFLTAKEPWCDTYIIEKMIESIEIKK